VTTDSLSWQKTKDSLVLGIGAVLIVILGYLATGLATANASLGEVKRDIAVLVAEKQRDREELAEVKERLRTLETRGGRI
jgi:Tfp pilus assembly protein PilN